MGVIKDLVEILLNGLKELSKHIRRIATVGRAEEIIGAITRELLKKEPDINVVEEMLEELEDYEPTKCELRRIDDLVKRVKTFQAPGRPSSAKGRPVAKKAVAKKPVGKKVVAKKLATKKAVAKKPLAKKASGKKPVAKKA